MNKMIERIRKGFADIQLEVFVWNRKSTLPSFTFGRVTLHAYDYNNTQILYC